jgi:hypothetical protein
VLVLAALAMGVASTARASYVLRGVGDDSGSLFAPRGEINDVMVAYDAAARVYVIQDSAEIATVGSRGAGSAGSARSGCERIFELWPSTVPLCGRCTFKLEARIGSRSSFVAELRATLTPKKAWVLIPLGPRARALVKSRGTLRVRVRFGSGSGGLYAREWFVLRR